MQFPAPVPLPFGGATADLLYTLQPRSTTFEAEFPGYFRAQFFEKPVLTQLLQSWLAALESAETAVIDLRNKRDASRVLGVWLDNVGSLVGVAREGRTDATYRPLILAAIAVNRSRGLAADLINLARVLYSDASAAVAVTDTGVKQARVFVPTAVDASLAASWGAQLHRAKPAGVRLTFQYITADLSDTFTLNGTAAQGLDTGALSGGLTSA